MKELLRFVSISFALLSLASCQKEPTASFTASKSVVSVNESISFNNTSFNASSFEWDFGDGSISTSENPSHSYANAGSYVVTLRAFSKNGNKTNKATTTITVEEKDPCEGINCLNGGRCINGECDCADGYTGPNCGSQITPSKIRITNIRVTKFPATDKGAGWDLTSGPDIYVTMEYNGSLIYKHPNFYQNANPSQNYDFQPNINLNMNAPTDYYIIRLYDYDDFSADDYMGGIQFIPYQDGNKFPTTITLDAGGEVAFELSVVYAW